LKGGLSSAADAWVWIVESTQEVRPRSVGLGAKVSERHDRNKANFLGGITQDAAKRRDRSGSATLESTCGQGPCIGYFCKKGLLKDIARCWTEDK